MTKLQGDQISFLADEVAAESVCGDWEYDCRPPIQDRSIAEIRADLIARARGEMPTVHNQLWTTPEPEPEPTVHNQLWTIPEPEPEPIVHNQLWTTPEPELSTVHNSPGTDRTYRYALPNMYRSWSKNHQYWYIKPYVNGERKTYHLGKDYDAAVAKGRKILAQVTGKEYEDSDS